MTLDEIIQNRRSIRKFKDTPVSRKDIEACINAARLAPSACNSQPWHFAVMEDKKAKEEFCGKVFGTIYSVTKFAAQAPVLIAVVGTRGGNLLARFGQVLSGTRFYLLDQGLACQNFALKAQELGLGTCFVGWFDTKAARKALNLPLDKNIELLIALGYPNEAPSPRPRKEIKEIISYNKYL